MSEIAMYSPWVDSGNCHNPRRMSYNPHWDTQLLHKYNTQNKWLLQ
jgi:hypothetical protein